MPKVGDRVTVTVRGEAELGSTATLSKGGVFTVGGEIVGDMGESWLVKIDFSFDGRNRMVVPKSAYKEAMQ